MNTHEEILERMSSANPLADPEMITDGQLAELTLQIEEQRSVAVDRRSRRPAAQPGAPAPRSRPWLRPALAFGTACLIALGAIGMVALVQSNESDVAEEPAPPSTTPAAPTTTLPAQVIATSSSVNNVQSLAVAPDGSLWATTEGGVVRWDLATLNPTVYTTAQGLPANRAHDIAVAADGTVWVGEAGWIARFDGTWTTFSAPRDTRGPLAVGPDGSVWAAFGEYRLGRLDGSEWEFYRSPLSWSNGVGGPWTGSLAIDPAGVVWVGAEVPADTAGAHWGVWEFDGNEWTLHSDAAGLPDGSGLPADIGSTVAIASDGTVWVASETINERQGGGIAHFDGTEWTGYTAADGLPGTDVMVMAGGGAVWAAGHNGIARFDGTTWHTYEGQGGLGFGAAVDGSGTLWMSAFEPGGGDLGIVGFDGTNTIRLLVPVNAPPTNDITLVDEGWNPILAETQATPAPAAATCPSGTDPNAPGPSGQARPDPAFVGVQAGAFNTHTGRILYVDSLGETWTFDVCTNTWERMSPSGAMMGDLSAGLVYDVDSDVTVAFTWDASSVYDAGANSWTQGAAFPGEGAPFGAVYDPASGLIVTTSYEGEEGSAANPARLEAWAYDVDGNTWTHLGRLRTEGDEPFWLDLLGYSPAIDRFILASPENVTVLADLRTGATNQAATPTPAVTFGWPKAQFGPAADTVFVARGATYDGEAWTDRFEDQICGFDPDTTAWTRCFAMPGGRRHAAFGAMVGDSINNRLVLINGIYGSFWVNSDDAVWAIDLDTGETTDLLGRDG